MRFAQTNRNRRRFLRDVPTVSYHPSSRRPGRPLAGSPRHRHSGHSPTTTVALIALYVSGLILLDGRQTQRHAWRSFCPAGLTMPSKAGF